MLGGVAALGAAGAISPFAGKAAASTGSVSAARPALAQDAKVSFGTGGTDAELEMFDKILDRFQEANSGYEIDRRYDPTQTWPKVINQLRSGTASDVQRLNDDSVFMMVSVDAVKVLDEWFDRDLKRADYYDIAFTERVGPGGTLGSAYVSSAPLVAFYNLDLFEAAGVTPPTTWDGADNLDIAGWEDMFSKLLKKDGDRVDVYPFWAPYWQIETAFYNGGVDFFSEDETRTTLNQPASLDILTRWQSWFEKDYFAPEGEDEEQLFNSGLLAIYMTYADFAYRVNSSIRFDIGPTWSGTRVKAFHAGRNFAIPSASASPDQAWELSKWLLTEGQTEMAEIDWGVPMLKSVATGPAFLNPEKPIGNHALLPAAMDIGSIPWPINPVSEAFQVPFRRLSAVNSGEQSPQDFLTEADSYLTGILESAGWNKSMNTADYRMDDTTFDKAQPPEEEG
jgi:multiple sugar transport system substrate-binding protein